MSLSFSYKVGNLGFLYIIAFIKIKLNWNIFKINYQQQVAKIAYSLNTFCNLGYTQNRREQQSGYQATYS